MIVFLLLPFLVFSGNEKLLDFANKLGVSSNASKGGMYKTQGKRFVTGGSLHLRAPRENINLINITPPSFNIGCGHLSLQAGGFSFIDSDQLVKSLKSITSAAGTYAFMLALKSIAPMVSGTMDTMRYIQQWANKTSIDACDVGSALVQGAALLSDTTSRKVCESKGMKVGAFSDYANALHDCSSKEKRDEINADAEDSEKLLTDNFNLAWTVINEHPMLERQPRDSKELLMSISGTLVRQDGESKYYASMTNKGNLIDVMLYGGNARVYRCDDERDCLNVTCRADHNVSIHEGLANKIDRQIREMIDIIHKNEEELSDEHLALLEKSNFDLNGFLNASLAVSPSMAKQRASQIIEVLAIDILLRFFDESLNRLLESSKNIGEKIAGTAAEKFIKETNEVKQSLLQMRRDFYKKYEIGYVLREETELMRQKLATNLEEKEDNESM